LKRQTIFSPGTSVAVVANFATTETERNSSLKTFAMCFPIVLISLSDACNFVAFFFVNYFRHANIREIPAAVLAGDLIRLIRV